MTDNRDDRRGPPNRGHGAARGGPDSPRGRSEKPRGPGGDRPLRRPGGAGPDRPPADARPRAPARETRPAEAADQHRAADEAGEAADTEARLLPVEDRIAKVIARAGVASRRDADAMILAGRVTLNGAPLASPAINVGPDDRITVDGEALPLRERTRLWLFHKPRGLVTTFRDPQARPTVFEALPDDMPRVVAIGRLDINTEGLLLLTNDGGLAKVIAHPETGWTRRYRVRARGEVTQPELDKLRNGIRVDDMDYGPVEATLDRMQGDNIWLTLALREGKNREVKRILEHLGLQVNRLIRLSFGPFQLGDLESGLVDEVKTKVLRDQLGQALAAEAGVDFESPVREPIAPFGREAAPAAREDSRPSRGDWAERPPRAGRMPEPRRASSENRFGERSYGARPGPSDGPRRGGPSGPRGAPPRGAAQDGSREAPRKFDRFARKETTWRAEREDGASAPPRHDRRDDPKADRAAAAMRPRERLPPIEAAEGRRIKVERVVKPARDEGEAPRHPRGRPRPDRDNGPRAFERPPGRPGAGRSGAREDRGGRDDRGPPRGERAFGKDRPARADGPGRPGGFGKPGGRPGGFGKPGAGGPAGKRPFKPGPPRGGRPGGGPRTER